MPPPRRANREPTEYISQADWDAIRDYRAFKSAAPETTASSPPANDAASAVSETTASAVELTTPRSSATTASSPPANDAASAVSETTASAVDLTTPQEWAENYCRRPLEPFVFGVFFDTHNVSDREVRMRETVVGLRFLRGTPHSWVALSALPARLRRRWADHRPSTRPPSGVASCCVCGYVRALHAPNVSDQCDPDT